MADKMITWDARDQAEFERALAAIARDNSGAKLGRKLYYPARRYVQTVTRSTKIGKRTATPLAWWTSTHRYATWIDKGRARGGSSEFAVPSRLRRPEPVAGRGFARNTWKPIARRMGVTIRGQHEEYAGLKAGRSRIMKRMTATNRRGVYADYDIDDKGTSPRFVFTNTSEAVINQDAGSKGMPPRHIHAKGMIAAGKQLAKEMDKAGLEMARTWER